MEPVETEPLYQVVDVVPEDPVKKYGADESSANVYAAAKAVGKEF